ncbi:MAG: hypothetical protein LIO43_01270, partial [Clostridiales bacterium]|nr:hypothetical protein [Clostridiales bacterium]
LKKILQIIGAIAAIAGVISAVYIAIQKLTGKKEPEYFDDNDFFECDNDLEIIEVDGKSENSENNTEAEEKKPLPKRKKAAKSTAK